MNNNIAKYRLDESSCLPFCVVVVASVEGVVIGALVLVVPLPNASCKA